MSEQPLLVTVDVEGVVSTGSYESVDELDELVRTLDVPVTLFVTPAVVRNRTGKVRSWVESEHAVGLHLHPGRMGGDSDWLATYDESAIRRFLREGRNTFAEQLDFRPSLFRAGRWSFSESLLRALAAEGFERDASHRPAVRRDPYESYGVTEFPMTVVGNTFTHLAFRRFGIDGVPLHADGFGQTLPRYVMLLGATAIVRATDRPYLMVSFHDYDLVSADIYGRIERYLKNLCRKQRATTVPDLPVVKPD